MTLTHKIAGIDIAKDKIDICVGTGSLKAIAKNPNDHNGRLDNEIKALESQLNDLIDKDEGCMGAMPS